MNQSLPTPQKLFGQEETELTLESKQTWSIEEDVIICLLVKKIGTKKWNSISDQLKARIPHCTRNGKQCRERWHNHLDPCIKKANWDQLEEEQFILTHKLHGNKWAEISKHIPGRSDNNIKNHFYSKIRTVIGKISKQDPSNELYQSAEICKQMLYFVKHLRDFLSYQEEGSAQSGETPIQFDSYVMNRLK